MKKLHTKAAIFALLVGLVWSGESMLAQTTIWGGRGLLRVQSAETIGRRTFYLNSYFGTFLQAKPQQTTLGKDHTLTIGLTYGFSPLLEITALLTPYQDDQQHVWGPPGDSQLGLKFRTPFSGSSIITSVWLFTRIPTAKVANVPFEPYSSGKLGAGAMAIMTLDMTESFPLFPLKAHLNFGYMDHNLKDALFNDPEDQFLLGAGFKFPIRSTIVYTEYTAEVFANNPVITQFNQNSQRITQGLKFLGPKNLIFDIAVDFSLSKKPDNPDRVFLKEYASWKFYVGINYQFFFDRSERGLVTRHRSRNDKAQKLELPPEVNERRQQIQDELKKMEKTLKKEKDKKNKSEHEN
ncbi:MAG: hypothetical protein Q9P14_05405 [candidate division KSB1 bacterium]|nr:hypothetical protein [candidate division KSB1 bacterium]MDQ7065312.1 hypothetical protein [candidate division KSB1 bacterium]